MNLTISIIVNAVLDVLVIAALFRVMWFGYSLPHGAPSELRRLERRRAAERDRQAA